MIERLLKIIGITGGSGSGKAAVCEILAKKGAYVIDTDGISHEIILKGEPAYYEIIQAFGNGFLDENEEIIRKSLSELVFSDNQKLDKLTQITHKYIIAKSLDEIKRIQGQSNAYSAIVIDAPLLIEANMHKICDVVWLIHADIEKRIERIMRRDKITREHAVSRIGSQTAAELLKPHADVLIENNGTVTELKSEVERLFCDVLRV